MIRQGDFTTNRQKTKFRTYQKAIFEDLITGYEVTLQGRLDTTPIRIEIEASSSEKEIP